MAIGVLAGAPLHAQVQAPLFLPSTSNPNQSNARLLEGFDFPPSLQSLLSMATGINSVVDWDFDADGDRDLVIAALSGGLYLLRNGPGTLATAGDDQPWGVFTDATARLSGLNWPAGYAVTAMDSGDIDGDGIEDLVVATDKTTSNGRIVIVHGDTGSNLTLSFPGQSTAAGATDFLNWLSPPNFQVVDLKLADISGPGGTGPGDGVLDIVACRGTYDAAFGTPPPVWDPGRALFAANNGTGAFFTEDLPPAPLMNDVTSNGSCVVAADFDADGLTDLFMGASPVQVTSGNFSIGVSRLYLRNAGGGWADATQALGVMAQNVFSAIAFDADADNDLDLIRFSADPAGGTHTTSVVLAMPGAPLAFAPGNVLLQYLNPNVLTLPAEFPLRANGNRDLLTGDFDGDGLDDFLDLAGSLWLGTPNGLAPGGTIIDNAAEPGSNYLPNGATSPSMLFGISAVAIDVDWDGDLDVLGMWQFPERNASGSTVTPTWKCFEWRNVTRQLDGPLNVDVSTSPTKQYWFYDRLTQSLVILPFLAADLNYLSVRVPYGGMNGLLGLTTSHVGLGSPSTPLNGNTYSVDLPLSFAGVPPGTMIYYQAALLDLVTAPNSWFTNVIRVRCY